jgi:hypothetical protein
MLRCIEPELWATIPDWDAPDELIQQYLEHLNACPYHAEEERRGTDAVRLTFDAARSVTPDGALTFSGEEEAAALEELDRLDAFRHSGAQIGELTFKINGEEIASLDFVNGRKRKLKLDRRQPLQIYGRGGAGENNLLLATYVPTVLDQPGSYLVPLNKQQTLNLIVEPSRGAKVKLTIACSTPVPYEQRQGWLASLILGDLFIPAVSTLVAVLIVIFGANVFDIGFIPAGGKADDSNIVQIARNNKGHTDQPAATHKAIPQPTTQPTQEGRRATSTPSLTQDGLTGLPARPDETVVRPTILTMPSSAAGGLRAGASRVEAITSLNDVHKLFIDDQAGVFGQTLRSLIVSLFDELGIETKVSRAESDARLRLKWEGGNSVTFTIISGERELLNFKAEYAASTPEEAGAIALKLKEQIQAKLK